MAVSQSNDSFFAPGTVRLTGKGHRFPTNFLPRISLSPGLVPSTEEADEHAIIDVKVGLILQPQPSSDPNDPLVSNASNFKHCRQN